MSAKDRQEERCTARLIGRGEVVARYLVVDEFGLTAAVIEVPPTDAGRSTVAKMVAALQMEEALEAEAKAQEHERRWRKEGQPHGRLSLEWREKADALRPVALEAAKRLP